MDGLVSLLIFAGLFYVLMRFGCGAHMVHGHNSQEKTKQKKDVDPVCGTEIEFTQGYGKMHEKILYRFCSRACLDKFEIEPEKYSQSKHTNGGKLS